MATTVIPRCAELLAGCQCQAWRVWRPRAAGSTAGLRGSPHASRRSSTVRSRPMMHRFDCAWQSGSSTHTISSVGSLGQTRAFHLGAREHRSDSTYRDASASRVRQRPQEREFWLLALRPVLRSDLLGPKAYGPSRVTVRAPTRVGLDRDRERDHAAHSWCLHASMIRATAHGGAWTRCGRL